MNAVLKDEIQQENMASQILLRLCCKWQNIPEMCDQRPVVENG